MYNIKFSRRYPRVVVPVPRNFANETEPEAAAEYCIGCEDDDKFTPTAMGTPLVTMPFGMVVGAGIPYLLNQLNGSIPTGDLVPAMAAGGALGALPGLASTWGAAKDDRRTSEQLMKQWDITGSLLNTGMQQASRSKARRH